MRTRIAAWTLCLSLTPTLAAANSPASGALEAPRGSMSGDVYVLAAAHDADGLHKVTVSFVAGQDPLVLCHDEDPTQPCPASLAGGTIEVDLRRRNRRLRPTSTAAAVCW